ncbi:hypothetical protein KY290_006939 [Solanum tuberosum]|uniref:RING-type domain-containing protein n=1 Tax=Solanum tuberosum TaxID=4113 RepID=A0ABQ7W625_SOLTU|nr:hypothetical protein KY290_006939 [Solanum tuberosum]
MGFDIECIIDIHTYPGEYFCPVCRTLVFPNEAVQSQCTHLYCKPCLAHVANWSRSCPYDGYLVTEADSKALIESDKTLAESIGRVKVRISITEVDAHGKVPCLIALLLCLMDKIPISKQMPALRLLLLLQLVCLLQSSDISNIINNMLDMSLINSKLISN